MKGLLYKDLCLIKSSSRVLVVAALVMLLISIWAVPDGNTFLMVYGAFLLGTLPMSLLSMDAASGWAAYSRTLPLTAEQIVGSRYLVGLGCTGASILLCSLSLAGSWLCAGGLPQGAFGQMLVVVVLVSLLGNCVLLPLSYRFDPGKARVFYILFVSALSALSAILMASPASFTLPPLGVGAVAAGVLALYAGSWRLSVAWYQRQEK